MRTTKIAMHLRLRLMCILAVVAILRAQNPPPLSVEEIRTRALAALAANAGRTKDLLWSEQTWTEFTGQHANPCLNGCSEVRTQTPSLRSHVGSMFGRLVTVLDGWDDQTPLQYRFPLEQRMNLGNVLSLKDLTAEFLSENRRLTFVTVKMDRNKRAYVLRSEPGRTSPRATGPVKCAGGMIAILTIDADTLFPIRGDAQVTKAQACADDYYREPGTKLQYHFSAVRGKDSCGESREIYARDQTATTSTLLSDGVILAPGTVAERRVLPGPNYRGGALKQITTSDGFKVFMACSSIRFGDSADSPLARGQSPVEFSEVEAYFGLEGIAASYGATARTLLLGVGASAQPFQRHVLRSAAPGKSEREQRGIFAAGDWFGAAGDWNTRTIDAKGFEGTRLGAGEDFSLSPTLKAAVLAKGAELYRPLSAPRGWIEYELERELLTKRMLETFGDGVLSAERFAAMLLALSVSPDPAMPGAVVFHWKWEWNFARALTAAQRGHASRFWRANFYVNPQANERILAGGGGMALINVGQEARKTIQVGLSVGCVHPNVAAGAYLAYESGDNQVTSLPVELELSALSPAMVFFHFSDDRAVADKLAGALARKGLSAKSYSDVDEDNNVIGSSIYTWGTRLGNFIQSHYHGELCGR